MKKAKKVAENGDISRSAMPAEARSSILVAFPPLLAV
jgi:hypothetical protein